MGYAWRKIYCASCICGTPKERRYYICCCASSCPFYKIEYLLFWFQMGGSAGGLQLELLLCTQFSAVTALSRSENLLHSISTCSYFVQVLSVVAIVVSTKLI